MPSYDKAKMMRLLEARRVVNLTSNDLYARLRELRVQINGKREFMRGNGDFHDSRDAVEALIEMPLDKALALTRDEVEKFRQPTYAVTGTQQAQASTGIGFGLWGEYLQLLQRKQRLEAEVERLHQARDEQFACVVPLVSAVTKWGFPSPEHEL